MLDVPIGSGGLCTCARGAAACNLGGVQGSPQKIARTSFCRRPDLLPGKPFKASAQPLRPRTSCLDREPAHCGFPRGIKVSRTHAPKKPLSHTIPCGASRKPTSQHCAFGWCQRIRDHAACCFLDLRDTTAHPGGATPTRRRSKRPRRCSRNGWCGSMAVGVARRARRHEKPELPTGASEVYITTSRCSPSAGELRLPVSSSRISGRDPAEYAFLDLRRERLHLNIICARVIDFHPRRNEEQASSSFNPDLTASSPECARRLSRASRLHPGTFLRAAASAAAVRSMFLIMVAGFDRLFPDSRQASAIEDARADRSPGQFLSARPGMSFVTQQDVFERSSR